MLYAFHIFLDEMMNEELSPQYTHRKERYVFHTRALFRICLSSKLGTQTFEILILLKREYKVKSNARP